MIDLARIKAESHGFMVKALKEIEDAREAIPIASEIYLTKSAESKKLAKERTLRYKEEGMPVSLIDKLVKGDCAQLDMEAEKAKGEERYLYKQIELRIEKINVLKHIDRSTEGVG